jgi:4-alpha-glucanotransferase
VIAEDLGVIPEFARETLASLAIPGYKVLPWERDARGARDPRAFVPRSVTTYGTHDTEPIVSWLKSMTDLERGELLHMAEWNSTLESQERALLRLAMQSGSNLTLLLFQELLGMPERINTPGTVSDANWTLRLGSVLERSEILDRFAWIRELAAQSGRI